MKAIFKSTSKNVISYRRIGNKGWEFIEETIDEETFFNSVQNLEDSDFFPQEDGRVLSASGNEVFDPKYPDSFDFGDYSYYLENVDEWDEWNDSHKINAMKGK